MRHTDGIAFDELVQAVMQIASDEDNAGEAKLIKPLQDAIARLFEEHRQPAAPGKTAAVKAACLTVIGELEEAIDEGLEALTPFHVTASRHVSRMWSAGGAPISLEAAPWQASGSQWDIDTLAEAREYGRQVLGEEPSDEEVLFYRNAVYGLPTDGILPPSPPSEDDADPMAWLMNALPPVDQLRNHVANFGNFLRAPFGRTEDPVATPLQQLQQAENEAAVSQRVLRASAAEVTDPDIRRLLLEQLQRVEQRLSNARALYQASGELDPTF
ncbi:MAG: hypothetical protein ACRYGK_00310 [Janthinobacterium lividum]